MNNLAKFNHFYNENKHRIYMKKDINYPINYSKAIQWVNTQCDLESSEFADKIIRNTRYVSFGEFINNIIKISESYKESYKNEKDTVFILIVPYELSKSNLWVTLLVYEYIKELISDVHHDVTSIYNMTVDSKSKLYRKRVRCIICDDCAYTGSQIQHTVKLDNLRIQYKNKKNQPDNKTKEWLKWYDNTISDSESNIKNISIDNFSIDLIIPFMSSLALKKISDIHYVKIPKNTCVFPLFRDQVNMDNLPSGIVNEFKSTFQYHKDISALYFDHKIADAISTFNKIYYLAPLFNCTISNVNIPFIEGCNIKIPEDINVYDQYIAVENATINKLCPVVFYKGIEYTFNGKKVDKNLTLYEIFS